MISHTRLKLELFTPVRKLCDEVEVVKCFWQTQQNWCHNNQHCTPMARLSKQSGQPMLALDLLAECKKLGIHLPTFRLQCRIAVAIAMLLPFNGHVRSYCNNVRIEKKCKSYHKCREFINRQGVEVWRNLPSGGVDIVERCTPSRQSPMPCRRSMTIWRSHLHLVWDCVKLWRKPEKKKNEDWGRQLINKNK